MIFVLNGVENILGKGENAGNQHFLLFPQCFQSQKCGLCGKGLNRHERGKGIT